jgi:hypothetical protein
LSFTLCADGRAVASRDPIDTTAVSLTLAAVDARSNRDQIRDDEIAAIVARTWSAQVVSTVARMNRDRAHGEAKEYITAELREFRRYVEGLVCGQELVRELQLLASRIGREFSPRMLKEMVVQSELSMESRVDRRGSDKADWSARLERGD